MSTPEDRDPITDRLLKRALTPPDAVAAGVCPDAEMLAAWADGAIAGPEAEAIERHLSSCARCQAILATFANAELAEAAPVSGGATTGRRSDVVVPFQSRSRVMNRWIPVALGAVAASLVIYAAWPARPTSDANRAEQTIASAPAPQQPAGAAGVDAFRQAGQSTPTAGPVAAARKAEDAKLAKSSPRPTRLDAVEEVTLTTASRGSVTTKPEPAAVSPTPTPAPRAAPAAAPATSGVTMAAPPPPAPVVPQTPARPPEVIMLRGTSETESRIDPAMRVIAEFTSPASATPGGIGQSLIGARGGGAGAAGGAGGGGGGRGGIAATPRPTARVNWRVLASGVVERSTNGGQTWSPVTISPAAPIVSGAAPSANVCWLIGRTGIVMLSTDGVTFRRVKFSDAGGVADLRSITAIDEFTATVTTVDGRVFKTEDGGETWKGPFLIPSGN